MECKSTIPDEKVSKNRTQKTPADRKVKVPKATTCLNAIITDTTPSNEPCDVMEGDTRNNIRVRKVGKRAKNWLQPPLRLLTSSATCPPLLEQSSLAGMDEPLTDAVKVKDNETPPPPTSFQPVMKPSISAGSPPAIEQSVKENAASGNEVQTNPAKINCSQSSEPPTSFPPVTKPNSCAASLSAIEESSLDNISMASENKKQTDAVKMACSQASEPPTIQSITKHGPPSSEDLTHGSSASENGLKKDCLSALDTEFTSYKILPMATGVKSAGSKVATFCVKFDGCQSVDWMTFKNDEMKKLSKIGSKSRPASLNSSSQKGFPQKTPLKEARKRTQCTANAKPCKNRKKEEKSISKSAPSSRQDEGDPKKPQGITKSKCRKDKPEISQEDQALRMIKPWLFGGSKCCMPLCNSYSVQGIKHFRIPHGRHRYSERDCVSWTAEFQEVVFKYRSDQKFTARVKGGSAYICELHFDESDFINGEKRVRLKYGVVPTKHLYYKHHAKRSPPEKIKRKRGRPRKGFGKKANIKTGKKIPRPAHQHSEKMDSTEEQMTSEDFSCQFGKSYLRGDSD